MEASAPSTVVRPPAGASLADSAGPADRYAAAASCGTVLGSLYLNDPRTEEARRVVDLLAGTDLGAAWPFGDPAELARADGLIARGAAAPAADLGEEYKRQFVGPGHFEAPAWGSVYLDKDEVVFGVSELELRQWMRSNGIAAHGAPREPVDHIGRLLALLGWLASEKPGLVGELLGDHLMPWAPRYLDLLEASARQPFYQGLAVLTRTTLQGMAGEFGVRVAARQLYH